MRRVYVHTELSCRSIPALEDYTVDGTTTGALDPNKTSA